jgi:hypothetical protein
MANVLAWRGNILSGKHLVWEFSRNSLNAHNDKTPPDIHEHVSSQIDEGRAVGAENFGAKPARIFPCLVCKPEHKWSLSVDGGLLGWPDMLPVGAQRNMHRLQQAQWMDVAKRALEKNKRIAPPELSSIVLLPGILFGQQMSILLPVAGQSCVTLMSKFGHPSSA